MTAISVALPVHNARATLAQTLDSLVNQTHSEFTVVVLDDASTDESVAIAQSYQGRLKLRLIQAERNLGISGARNRLLAEIESPFIAILDHDDICHPERLARQHAYLQAHPEIDIVGSAVTYFSEVADLPNATRVLRHPSDDAAIKTKLLHNCPMVHPSALARRSFFADAGGYLAEFSPAEDYALWCRAALLGKRFANLDESLLFYRLHPTQTSQVQGQRMVLKDIEIKRFYIRALLGGDSDASLAELLCPYLHHASKQILASALPGLMPVILKLAQRVPCLATYSTLMSQVLGERILQAH